MTRSLAPRPRLSQRQREQLRARNAPPPDPDAWQAFLCQRCEQPFRFQGIARCCVRCVSMAAGAGVAGSEWIGEVSGA